MSEHEEVTSHHENDEICDYGTVGLVYHAEFRSPFAF